MPDRGKVEIRVIHAPKGTVTLKAFRNATDATIVTIRDALTRHTPIAAAQLYGCDHDHAEQTLLTLFNELDSLDVQYEIIIDGKCESRNYLSNILQRWREIGLETRMMANLEIGEPDVETLEWLQSTAPADVFHSTLEQIINGDGYNVDSETLTWARHQLGDA